ncbi:MULTISPECIES: hypothetical protein [Rhodococcus]|uniref:hypothetical protein n=1 Tax=Rhodococcus TaxID=1827 RepID=UPI0020407AF6|nr:MULTISPECIES: hypothetical protein [Rhodococcus]USC16958.1 hypothetical protein KZJ41_08865 [Rhodococcus sp. 11-3]WFS13352.1 hypothetical protein P9K37_27055 [Rhodococcus aetherivorans]
MTVDPATTATEAPAPPAPKPRPGIVALLTFDGFLCALLSVFFLGLYIGTVPFPITIVLAGAANMLLVMAMRAETGSASRAAWPLLAWIVGFVVCLAGGSGGDQLLVADWRTLLLPVGALAPAGLHLFVARMAALTSAVRQPAPRP